MVVHMIGNAHIDPVWLWGWQHGVDEALASFRAAADRCDEYPEFVYTRGEAWLYRQVQTLDPGLFRRIKGLVEKGQWHIEGGQFIQPDVNGPTAEGLRRQIEAGQRYFSREFAVRPRIGYNLDSFGHPATLPDILHDCGYRAYVFHRPKPDQVELPAPAFRWRGVNGAEVLAFRIVPGYTTLGEDLTGHIEKAVELADPRVGHTMCFYGVGNHGGGPTKADIAFILENRHSIDGVELRFSTPQAFFDAIGGKRDLLPVVSEELQRTFPGCYSVMHDIKQEQRHGEHLLQQAEAAIAAFADERAAKLTAKLDMAWEDLLFAAFHDILAGTSIPSAWRSVRAMQGRARISGEEIVVESSRAWARQRLPDVNHQQLVVLNPDDTARHEVVEVEPWLDMDSWGARWMSDMEGRPVEYQLLQPEAPQITTRLLLPVSVPPRGALQLLIRDDEAPDLPPVPSDLQVTEELLANDRLTVRLDAGGIRELRAGGENLLGAGGIGLHLREDHTDTWTFHTDRFAESVAQTFTGEGWVVEERGPLRARLRNEGRIGTSRVRWTVDLPRGEARLAMRVEINFDERFRLLQLPMELAREPAHWLCGLAGGSVERVLGPVEWPVHGWSRVSMASAIAGAPAGGSGAEGRGGDAGSGATAGSGTNAGDGDSLALITQDAYSLSCNGNLWQWTLVRSPRMAWGGGDPQPYDGRDWHTDQGLHRFDFELHVGGQPTPAQLEERARRLAQPLVTMDRYEGMNRPLGRRESSAPVQALFQRSDDDSL